MPSATSADAGVSGGGLDGPHESMGEVPFFEELHESASSPSGPAASRGPLACDPAGATVWAGPSRPSASRTATWASRRSYAARHAKNTRPPDSAFATGQTPGTSFSAPDHVPSGLRTAPSAVSGGRAHVRTAPPSGATDSRSCVASVPDRVFTDDQSPCGLSVTVRTRSSSGQ